MGIRTEEELQAARALVAQLEERKKAEDEAKASVTAAVRQLAVRLHATQCTAKHPEECGWHRDVTADEPEGADWTQEDHQRWLTITRTSLGDMVRDGWTLIPPGASEPLPAPSDAAA